MNAPLLLGAIAMLAGSGVPGIFFGGRSPIGPRITAVLASLGSCCGLLAIWPIFAGPPFEACRWPTPLPNVDFVLGCDSLSAFFLVPIFVVSLLGSIYGLEYWSAHEHPESGRRLRLFYGLLAASLTTVVMAQNSVTFLMGWEVMAVSAFFAVSTEDEKSDVRDAGWLYLAASHAATLALIAMFGLLYGVTGSYDLSPLQPGVISPRMASIIFLLGLSGFGLKAGLMPLHFWLPSAHAMAPSHVSALMSGLLIKMGIYGLVRLTWMLPEPPLWWGGLLLVLGTTSAVLGIVFAMSQRDLKRLLAYSSIDNIGVIAVGLGLALVGRTLNQPLWIVLGLAGALMHLWNHAIFKSLLFFSAGVLLHISRTREIDALGGLAKKMPWTAIAFLIGAMAASGLPPMNGFIGEFLIYMGLFRTLGLDGGAELPAAAFVTPALALMGAVAVACFVKAYGIVFLGTPRQILPHPAHDPGWAMRLPMVVLSVACIALGVFPRITVPVLDQVCRTWSRDSLGSAALIDKAAPLAELNIVLILLLVMMAVGYGLLHRRIESDSITWQETWGCGFQAPTPRLQYTGSSLVQFLMTLFRWTLLPIEKRPVDRSFFPQNDEFESQVPEPVLDRAVLPLFRIAGSALQWSRLIQQGSVHVYLAYIVLILVLLLLIWH